MTNAKDEFGRDEVERAFKAYLAANGTGDWAAWADFFTDDALYVECEMGTFHGRQEIKNWITATMAHVPAMDFPVDWYVIEGNTVVMKVWNRLPNPRGGEPFQFAAMTTLHYAGDGKFSYEEDIYNAKTAEQVIADWAAASGIATPEIATS